MDIVRSLKATKSIDDADKYGFTAIQRAVLNGFISRVKMLLCLGASVHDKDSFGYSPILRASMNGYLDLVDMLLSKGANIHDKDLYAWSPIMRASFGSHGAIVDLLLSKGASAQDTNMYGLNSFGLTSNNSIRLVLSRWPTTMLILVFQDLKLYNILYDSLFDLLEYVGDL